LAVSLPPFTIAPFRVTRSTDGAKALYACIRILIFPAPRRFAVRGFSATTDQPQGADTMPCIVSPAPQFTSLTEAEVMAALNDPDPGNPIAVELARLIEGYTDNFRAHVERLGYFPSDILHVTPQTAIEAVAMRLTTEAIQETVAGRGS
jgi:hypothetical protein